MNSLGAVVQHILCSNTRSLQRCHPFKGSVVNLAFSVPKPYSISSIPFRRKQTCPVNSITACGVIEGIAISFPHIKRDYATSPIIRKFKDVPRKYRDQHGLPFRATPLSQDEISTIFGPGVDARIANRAMRILHGRRVAGTLGDPSLGFPISGVSDRIQAIALSWLRKNVSVDEDYAAARKMEIELGAAEAEVLTESEKLGLYRPNASETSPDKENGGNNSIYGESGLDVIRESYKQRRLQDDDEMEATYKENQTGMQLRDSLGTGKSRVELETPREQHPWKKYYLERAKVLPSTPPEMSVWQRIWPSGIVTLLVVGMSVVFATVYTPPTRESRLWPDVPPAAATILGLFLVNLSIFILWHHPPAFRILNKYFMSVPGYPRALAIIGNTFSHQELRHFLGNMLMLWIFGTRLHDEVGRGNFLAIYLSTGVVASFLSLGVFSYLSIFVTASAGASGSLFGVAAAFLWLHRHDDYKILGLPPSPAPGIPGYIPLVAIILYDLWKLRKIGTSGIDHVAHLGGFTAGIVSGEILERRARQRRHLELEIRKKLTTAVRG